jgi:NADH-quinone oxidoreductase subunit M
MLAWTIYISMLGAAILLILPRGNAIASRLVALVSTVLGLALGIAACARHTSGGMQIIAHAPWVTSLGIEYALAADGISLALVLLTGVIAVTGVLFAWNVEHRVSEFFALYLVLVGAVYGVFLSSDLFLLFVFYELVIIPKYFLIAIWGSTRREYGAMKLAIYSFVGSAMILVGLIAAYVAAGSSTMSLPALAQAHFSAHFQMMAFPLVFAGFAVLAGMWPFHTWAPTGHVAAPTAASMLLAGVVMKLGAYGCLRIAMVLFPLGLGPWGFHIMGLGSWRDVFAVLGVIGIVYGASVAMVQKDFKFVIGYSSVSHMGFILLGMMTLTRLGVAGAVMQMVSHGLLGSLLFAIVGRMIYSRTHTRDLRLLGAMDLGRALPFAAIAFVIAAMASMGLPGFSGFIAELMVLLGTWSTYPALALLTGLGIILGVAYLWRAMHQAFFADSTPATNPQPPLAPISVPERIGACILIGASVFVGIYPQFLLRLIMPALSSSLFIGIRSGGGWQ